MQGVQKSSMQLVSDFREMFDSAPSMMWIADENGDCFYFNRCWLAFTGRTLDEEAGFGWSNGVHPDDLAACLGQYRDALGDRRQFQLEYRLRRHDGEYRWVLDNGAPRVSDGTFAGYIGSCVDITERKTAEMDAIRAAGNLEVRIADRTAELQESTNRMRRVFESDLIGLMFCDASGQIHDANDAFLKMLGRSREELLNKRLSWIALTAPEFRDGDQRFLHELLQNGACPAYEKEFLRKDGTRVSALVAGALLDGADGEIIGYVLDVSELAKARQEIDRLARIVETSDDAIISLSLDGRIQSWNKGAERLFGYPSSGVIGAPESILLSPGQHQTSVGLLRQRGNTESPEHFESSRKRHDGSIIPVSVALSPIHDRNGNLAGTAQIIRDLTEAKRASELEERYRHAQRIESVGRLAGGIAHDFNNLLMVITSYSELLQEHLPPEHPDRRYIAEVISAAERGSSLTQQMLAFSRRQVMSAEVINLDAIIRETLKMLGRMIGEDITLDYWPSPDLWSVKADSGQIVQVLLNLAVNARDAMPHGGSVVIRTCNKILDTSCPVENAVIAPGRYVVLSVADTGTGISAEIRDHIFEPFFTTKELGKGTGLGLSMVYGIVQQSGGYISLESTPGGGTHFDLYFPATDEVVVQAPSMIEPASAKSGNTILLVEDESALRASIADFLSEHGFTILQASDGLDALRVADSHTGLISVVLTDVVMPRLNGKELVDRLSAKRPDIKVLYMSGYADERVGRHALLENGAAFLQKPFTFSKLLAKLRELVTI